MHDRPRSRTRRVVLATLATVGAAILSLGSALPASAADDAAAAPVVPTPAATTITLSTPEQLVFGDPVVLDVTVGETANPETPGEGSVRVFMGTLPWGIEYPLIDGEAHITVGGIGPDGPFATSFAPGVYEVGAEFVPSDPPVQAGSTATPVAVTIAPGRSSVVLVAPGLLQAGQPTALFAVVSTAVEGTVYGTVSFFHDGVLIGSSEVSSNSAQVPWTPDAAGSVTLTAEYSGDPMYAASSSLPATYVVTAAAVVPPAEPPVADTGSRLADTGAPSSAALLAGFAAVVLVAAGLILHRRRVA
ncbi:Ig-like domain repeat protein [Herbiconiux sp. YIM B11900]|uniref:Ig-like domain-containing protein n=1 Tax=Herbiconiux sp. YIM B11900 TaxID=3404131 RepID=UPI003F85A3A9